MKTNFNLEEIEILDLGSNCDVFYYPKWLTYSEALRYFDVLNQKIIFKQHRVSLAGTLIDQPRLTCWFGDHSYTYSGLTIQPDPWFSELLELKNKLQQDLNINFNSVLANYYQDGSHYVGWHADNEAQIGPVIALVSLGGFESLRFRIKKLINTVIWNYKLEVF